MEERHRMISILLLPPKQSCHRDSSFALKASVRSQTRRHNSVLLMPFSRSILTNCCDILCKWLEVWIVGIGSGNYADGEGWVILQFFCTLLTAFRIYYCTSLHLFLSLLLVSVWICLCRLMSHTICPNYSMSAVCVRKPMCLSVSSSLCISLHLSIRLSLWLPSLPLVISLLLSVSVSVFLLQFSISSFFSSHTLSCWFHLVLAVCLIIHTSVCKSVSLSVWWSVRLSVRLSDRQPVCLSVCLFVCLSVSLSVYLSVSLSFYCLCACMFVCMSACVYVCQWTVSAVQRSVTACSLHVICLRMPGCLWDYELVASGAWIRYKRNHANGMKAGRQAGRQCQVNWDKVESVCCCR